MSVVDVDAHFMEPFDWLEKFDPDLAAKIPNFDMAGHFANIIAGEVIAQIPEEARPNAIDVLPEVHKEFLAKLPSGRASGEEVEACLDRFEESERGVIYRAFRSRGTWRASERIAVMDEHGIDKQFINPSIALGWAELARRELDDDGIHRAVLTAYNDWALEVVEGHEDRLLPIAYLSLDDLDWALAEIDRMYRRGVRAFHIPAQPVGGRSLGHPDFEPIWTLAEERGMAVVFHVAHAGTTVLESGWGNAGGNMLVSLMTYRTQQEQIPTLALTSMIFSGVFERHPRLVVMAQELGVDWLPYWVKKMDSILETNVYARHTPYNLPLKPSEYVQRNVFVSGLPTEMQALQPTFDQVPHGILIFCSDFPHPEGGAINDARVAYERQLEGYPADVKADFFGNAIARAMDL